MTSWLVRARISPWVAPGALLAAALALYPSLGQPASPLVMGVGGLACVLFVAAQTLPLPGALAWSLGMLALEYVISLELRGPTLDVAAPGYAAAFFLCAELGWLSLEARRGGRLWLGRAVAVAILALAGAALGSLLLLLAAVPLPGGAAITGLGVAGAVGVAACLAWLAQR